MSSDGEDTEENESWIQWFCRIKGNDFYCEVDKSYIEDGFNLYGLRNVVHNFQECLDIILDRLDSDFTQQESDSMTNSAMLLYGLIHARYILTSHGLSAMHKKYQQACFGKCPRFLCASQSVVPLGMHVEPEHDTVKVFCPKCGECYCPTSAHHVDGAFFGPTFPHLFFMTFSGDSGDTQPSGGNGALSSVPNPPEPPPRYVPRVYGFRVHASSPAATPMHHHQCALQGIAAAASAAQPSAPRPAPPSGATGQQQSSAGAAGAAGASSSSFSAAAATGGAASGGGGGSTTGTGAGGVRSGAVVVVEKDEPVGGDKKEDGHVAKRARPAAP